MADDGDRASAREEELRADALAAWRRANPPRPPFAKGGMAAGGGGRRWCADCGEAIPAARRAAVPGVKRCVGCESDRELM